MSQAIKHIFFPGLLWTSFFAGNVGNTNDWVRLRNVCSQPMFSAGSINSRPVNSKPSWVEQKHAVVSVRIVLSPQSLPVSGANLSGKHVLARLDLPAIRAEVRDVLFPRTSRAPPTI